MARTLDDKCRRQKLSSPSPKRTFFELNPYGLEATYSPRYTIGLTAAIIYTLLQLMVPAALAGISFMGNAWVYLARATANVNPDHHSPRMTSGGLLYDCGSTTIILCAVLLIIYGGRQGVLKTLRAQADRSATTRLIKERRQLQQIKSLLPLHPGCGTVVEIMETTNQDVTSKTNENSDAPQSKAEQSSTSGARPRGQTDAVSCAERERTLPAKTQTPPSTREDGATFSNYTHRHMAPMGRSTVYENKTYTGNTLEIISSKRWKKIQNVHDKQISSPGKLKGALAGLLGVVAAVGALGSLHEMEMFNSAQSSHNSQDFSSNDIVDAAAQMASLETAKPSFSNAYIPTPESILEKLDTERKHLPEYKQFMKLELECFRGTEGFPEMPHTTEINRPNETAMPIDLKAGFENTVAPCRRYGIPIKLRPIVRKALTEMINRGWIKPSTSPWCAPLMCIPKPHQEGVPFEKKKWRIVVDYSELNRRTETYHHRIPDITAAWDKLSQAKYLSVLDFTHGFWQCKIDPKDAPKTGFNTEFGHMEWVVMPMGLKNSPAFFCSNVENMMTRDGLLDMDMIQVGEDGKCIPPKAETQKDKPPHKYTLNGGVREVSLNASLPPVLEGQTPCATPYMDDVIVFSETAEDHFNDLCRVCECLARNQYYCNRDKCYFFCEMVTYVGGAVGNGVLAMDPRKTLAVKEWERPTNVTEIRSFLGTTNFLKRWIPNYSEIVKPITKLTKKGITVNTAWGSDQDKAFAEMKEAIAKYPVLRIPDFNKPFYIVTDACDHSLGGALMQDYAGLLLPCAYHSRTYVPAEYNYPVREKEMLALVDTFKKFSGYLVGSNFTVVCQTDHRSLECLHNGRTLQGRLARWREFLDSYDYDIQYIEGTDNLIGDGVSRSITAATATRMRKNGSFKNGCQKTPASEIDEMTAKLYTAIEGPALSALKVCTPPDPPLSAMYCAIDERFKTLDYAACPDFSEIWDLITADHALLPHLRDVRVRYYERVHNKLYYRNDDGTLALCIPSTATGTISSSASMDEAAPQVAEPVPILRPRRLAQEDPPIAQAVPPPPEGDIPLRHVLLYECHDSPYMGHRGAQRTYGEMRKIFWWPGIFKDVNKYVNSCVKCARAKTSRRKQLGRLKPNEIPRERMHSVTIDMITNLPEAGPEKYSQILVLVDRLTKKVFTAPLRSNITGPQLADLLCTTIFLEYGFPLEIISDRDTKFTSHYWENFFRAYGTKLSMSYAYHQRFDGQTEVMNRVLEEIMRCYVDFDQTNWPLLLPYSTSAMNNTVNPAIRRSPNELFYGRTVLRPVHLNLDPAGTLPDVRARIALVKHYTALSTEYTRHALQQMKLNHDKSNISRAIDPRLRVGAKCMIDARNITVPGHSSRPPKFTGRKHGPFTIIDKLSDVSFLIELPSTWTHWPVFHASMLYPIADGNEFATRVEPAPAGVDVDGHVTYTVTALTSARRFRRKIQYFCMFKGYPHVEDGMWHNRDYLKRRDVCPLLVADADLMYLDDIRVPPTDGRGPPIPLRLHDQPAGDAPLNHVWDRLAGEWMLARPPEEIDLGGV